MTWTTRARRRFVIRLALVFALLQLAALGGLYYGPLPAEWPRPGVGLLVTLMVIDVILLSVFAGWLVWGSVSIPLKELSGDVQRIADGDYHHRIGETNRLELREIRDSVNRLADRLIADQTLLADNVESLEASNRELVEARDEVVRSARLASVGTLAAGIAHEVGNPLGAIMAYVDVAAARARKAGADTELLDAVRQEAGRIDRIVRGLLDYARPPESAPDPVRARDVLERIRHLLESQGKLDGIEMSWELAEDEPHVVIEPHRLEQVIVNLLLNAVHAVEASSPPRIAVRLYGAEGRVPSFPVRREDDPPGINYMHRRRMKSRRAGDAVAKAARVTVIEVSDNGPGIPEEHLDSLFDPFFTTKEPGKGTGLGLSICARLVEGMGGRIDASNRPDGGARFIVRLPSVGELAVASAVTAHGAETT